jgi:hypothetical protein
MRDPMLVSCFRFPKNLTSAILQTPLVFLLALPIDLSLIARGLFAQSPDASDGLIADLPPSIAAHILNLPSDRATEPHEEKTIAIHFPVSAILEASQQGTMASIQVSIRGDLAGWQLLDFDPKSHQIPDALKPIELQREKTQDGVHHLDAAATIAPFAEAQLGYHLRAQTSHRERTWVAPPAKWAVTSGTTNAHRDLVVQWHHLPSQGVEGTHSIRVLAKVPSHWTSGMVFLTLEARWHNSRTGELAAGSVKPSSAIRQRWCPIYLAGDPGVQERVSQLLQAEQRLCNERQRLLMNPSEKPSIVPPWVLLRDIRRADQAELINQFIRVRPYPEYPSQAHAKLPTAARVAMLDFRDAFLALISKEAISIQVGRDPLVAVPLVQR